MMKSFIFTLQQLGYNKIFNNMNIKIFKPLILIIIPFISFFGCEQEFDNSIENFNTDYQVVSVTPADSFYYNPSDSLLTITVEFNSVSTIQNVYCDVYSSDYTKLSTVTLYDDGNSSKGDVTKDDMIYSNKLPLSWVYPNGIYNIKYYVTDNSNNSKQVAFSSFDYHNGQDNVAPVLSNLVLVDSTQRDVEITFSVDVYDENGLSDITKVYYELYRPNGSKVFNSEGVYQFPLFDNGNTASNGDVTAKDGRYTVLLTFPTSSSVPAGEWKFEFTAKDRAGALSESIIKSVILL